MLIMLAEVPFDRHRHVQLWPVTRSFKIGHLSSTEMEVALIYGYLHLEIGQTRIRNASCFSQTYFEWTDIVWSEYGS